MNVKLNKQYAIIIIMIYLILSGCLTNQRINVNNYINYTDKIYPVVIKTDDEIIQHVRYIPNSEKIVISEEKFINKARIGVIYFYNYRNQEKKEMFNPLSIEELRTVKDIEFINIVDLYILNNYRVFLQLWIGSNELRDNGKDFIAILYNYKNEEIILKEDKRLVDRIKKQSIYDRNIFYGYGFIKVYWQYINFVDDIMNITQKSFPELIIDNSKYSINICDGINEESFFYSQLTNEEINVLGLYSTIKDMTLKVINLPDSFQKYLKGNTVNINLSRDKKYLLLDSWPYGLWVYNLKNEQLYEICNTKYNWNRGFGRITVHYCDWSWDKNKILFTVYQGRVGASSLFYGIFELDLDKIDELNLRIIE